MSNINRKRTVIRSASSTITTTLSTLEVGANIIHNELVLIEATNKLENISEYAEQFNVTVDEAKAALGY